MKMTEKMFGDTIALAVIIVIAATVTYILNDRATADPCVQQGMLPHTLIIVTRDKHEVAYICGVAK